MHLTNVPALCRKALCIAGDPIMGAVISSFFNEEGEYFCLLEPPRMSRPDCSNEVIRRNNVAARFQPEKIVLAGLEERALSALQRYFSPKITTIINTLNEVPTKLREVKTSHTGGELICSPSEIVYGLLLAKILKKRLTIDDSAPSIKEKLRECISSSNHLIVVEDSGDFAPIIAANYAFSLNSNFVLIPAVNSQDVDKLYDDLMERSVFRSSSRGVRAETDLRTTSTKYHSLLPISGPDFITFVTRGVPYGYFFPDIPATHLLSYPDLGINIFAGIYYATGIKSTRSAIIVDPGHFAESESDFITLNLERKGIFVKNLKGDLATVYNVRNHIQYFPYDLLYICTHAGEMSGQRLKIRFNDRRGYSHVITIDHAAGLAPTGEGTGGDAKIEVLDFSRFVELDGIDWSDEKGKESIAVGEIMQDFTKIPPLQWEVIESREIPYVKYCTALKLTDHYCLGLFHMVAEHEHPVVFNNTCGSFYNFSGVFLFAGARSYIGTVTSVKNSEAKCLAEDVFINLNYKKPLPLILWEAQKRVWPNNPEDRTYVHVGSHFTNIVGPAQDVTPYLKLRLNAALERWSKKQGVVVNDLGIRDNIKVAINFLKTQILKNG